MPSTSAPVGQRLRQLRTAANLTQRQLAQKSGIHQTIISSLELGGYRVTYVTCVRLARALGFDNPLDVFPVLDEHEAVGA
jgi:transcriptional regulator with XRE-family HTH domain